MQFGTLPYDVAHLLGGVVLVLSFVLLTQRRVPAVINAYAAQAAALSLAAAWQAWVQGSPHLAFTAAITLAAKGVVMPLALHRILRRLALPVAAEAALPVLPSLALGVGLVVLAILVVLPTALSADIAAREALALALSVVLLGLLVMSTRRNALLQVVGFLSLENGLILAAVGAAGMPLVVELSTAVLVLVAFGVFGAFVLRIRDRFDNLDTAQLDGVGRSHR